MKQATQPRIKQVAGCLCVMYHPSMVHTHNPSPQEAEAVRQKFRDILGSIGNLEPAWAM